jgi:hypothetical protein
VRVGEVEDEGKQALSTVLAEVPVPAAPVVLLSARITRGSKVGCERGDALLAIDDDDDDDRVKDLAVDRVGDMPGILPIPTPKPVLALLAPELPGIPHAPVPVRAGG